MDKEAKKKLNLKERIFALELLADKKNRVEHAAILAGYSKTVARTAAYTWIKKDNPTKPYLAEYIEARRKKREERLELRADDVLRELAKITFFDFRKIFNEDGTVKAITEIDDDTAAAIIGVEVIENWMEGKHTGFIKKIKFVEKKGAVDSAMRHLGLFNDKLDLTVNPHDEFIKKHGHILGGSNTD